MIRQLKKSDIKVGIHILRNDVVSSAWLEDKVFTKEKLETFKEIYKITDKSKFKLIL